MDQTHRHNKRDMKKHKYVTIGIVSFTRRTKEEAKFEKQRRLSEKVWYQKLERWQRIENGKPKDA